MLRIIQNFQRESGGIALPLKDQTKDMLVPRPIRMNGCIMLSLEDRPEDFRLIIGTGTNLTVGNLICVSFQELETS